MTKTLASVAESFYEEHRKRHENAQTELLESYTNYQKNSLEQKIKLKGVFFVVSLIMMFIPPIILVAGYFAVYFGWVSSDSFTAIAAVGGGIVALIADMLTIPRIIAEYCFNKEEDKNIMQLFANAQKHDRKQQKSKL